MTTIIVTKGRKRRFEAPGVGWIQPKGIVSVDYVGEAEGVGEITLSRNWSGTKHTVTDSIGRVRGEFQFKGWAGTKGPLTWDDVDYEFAHDGVFKTTFVLRRHSEDLAEFTPKWTGSNVTVELLDNAHLPPGLILFGVWITLMRVQDAAAQQTPGVT